MLQHLVSLSTFLGDRHARGAGQSQFGESAEEGRVPGAALALFESACRVLGPGEDDHVSVVALWCLGHARFCRRAYRFNDIPVANRGTRRTPGGVVGILLHGDNAM